MSPADESSASAEQDLGFGRDTGLMGSCLCPNSAGYGLKDFPWENRSLLTPLLACGFPGFAEAQLFALDCLGLGLTEGYGLVGFVGLVRKGLVLGLTQTG